MSARSHILILEEWSPFLANVGVGVDSITSPGPGFGLTVSRFELADAESSALALKPEAVIVDLRNRLDEGVQTCRHLRSAVLGPPSVLVVLLAKANADRASEFWRAGADDVLLRPVSSMEFWTRVRSRLERVSELVSFGTGRTLSAGALRLDLDRQVATVGGQRIAVGPVEFRILAVLARSVGETCTRDQIIEFVWGDRVRVSRILDPHVTALRRKLSGSGLELHTLYGRGFVLREADSRP